MAQESWKRDQDETGCQQPEGPILEGPVLCTNNCGFFGSSSTMNLCSKCYRDIVVKQPNASFPTKALVGEKAMVSALGDKSLVPSVPLEKSVAVAAAAAAAAAAAVPQTDILMNTALRPEQPQPLVTTDGSPSTLLSGPGGPSGPSSSGNLSQPDQQGPRQTPNRCFTCRKRVGLTGFKCRCGDVFCALHRYSEKHNCSFDYKAAGRDAIAKANPLVKADKIEKI